MTDEQRIAELLREANPVAHPGDAMRVVRQTDPLWQIIRTRLDRAASLPDGFYEDAQATGAEGKGTTMSTTDTEHTRTAPQRKWVVAATVVAVLAVAAALVVALQQASDPQPDVVDSLDTELSGTATCEDGSGDVFAVDADGAPTEGTVEEGGWDLEQIVLTASRGSFSVRFPMETEAFQRQHLPADGQGHYDLWVQSADGSSSGLVRARLVDTSPAAAEEGRAWEYSAGSGPSDLQEITGSSTGEGEFNAGFSFSVDALPVPPESFRWVGMAINDGQGGDACPDVDPADPFSDPAKLVSFPADG